MTDDKKDNVDDEATDTPATDTPATDDEVGIPVAVSSNMIDVAIDSVDYYRFPGTTVTACCITLKNGFYVVGSSMSVVPSRWTAEVGQRMALEKAKIKVIDYQAYYLKQMIHQASSPS